MFPGSFMGTWKSILQVPTKDPTSVFHASITMILTTLDNKATARPWDSRGMPEQVPMPSSLWRRASTSAPYKLATFQADPWTESVAFLVHRAMVCYECSDITFGDILLTSPFLYTRLKKILISTCTILWGIHDLNISIFQYSYMYIQTNAQTNGNPKVNIQYLSKCT